VSSLRRDLQDKLKGNNIIPDPAGELRASLELDSDEGEGKSAACPQRARRLATTERFLNVMLGLGVRLA
jgi:hypothetical protein